MEEKTFDFFACVDFLMLQPVAGNVLGQSHHGLRQQLRISPSDLSSRHACFKERSQNRCALITRPDRKRTYRGVYVTDVVIVKEPALVFLYEVQVSVQHPVKTLQNGSICQRRPFQTALELPRVFDHEIDKEVVFAFEVQVKCPYRKLCLFNYFLDSQ